MTGIQEQARLVQVWQAFTAALPADAAVLRPVTLAAWQRCRELGIRPEQVEFRFLSDDALRARLVRHRALLAAAAPYLEYLSITLAGMPHVVALADAEGWVLALRGTPEVFGGEAVGVAVGASWAEQHIGNNGVGTALATGEPVLIYGVEHYAQVYHPATCLGVPIRDRDRVVGVLDISVRNEDADPARLTLAQACVASIESALAGVSAAAGSQVSTVDLVGAVHELKQPLAALHGTAQLGLRRSQDAAARQILHRIIGHADRLAAMVNDLLTQHLGDVSVAAKLGPLVQAVVQEVAPQCALQGITVHAEISDEALVHLRPQSLQRAVRNLISNAIEAMPAGGTLEVRLTDPDGHVLLTVSDSGPGIPPELQATVFLPGVSGRPHGTGLGLFQVYQAITQEHAGRVWFETTPERGTIFFVELPLAPPPQPPAWPVG